eukprot:4393285-Amphidinium_carterae.1
MTQAGYRSVPSYIAVARCRHVQLGFDLPPALKQYLKGAERSARRDLGPPSRAVTFDLEVLLKDIQVHEFQMQSAVPRAPCAAWASLVVATWFLLREVELMALHVGDVLREVGLTDKKLGLKLSKSKTDIEAKGCIRFPACICKEERGRVEICPACQLEQVAAMRKEQGAQDSDILFIAANGGPPDKRSVIQVWQDICYKHQLKDDLGGDAVRKLTGHSPRRSGAQWLARRGLQLWEIQHLGRWGSDAIELYIA